MSTYLFLRVILLFLTIVFQKVNATGKYISLEHIYKATLMWYISNFVLIFLDQTFAPVLNKVVWYAV